MSRLAVAITHVEFAESEPTLYVIHVQQDAEAWDVRRAFSAFRHLHASVLRVLTDAAHWRVQDGPSRAFLAAFRALALPPKRLFGTKTDKVIRERATRLHRFLLQLLLLTHTYRKEQKALLAHEELQETQDDARGHGSAQVFALLREFLKPVASPKRKDGDGSRRTTRVIRESRLLSTSPSNAAATAASTATSMTEAPRPSSLKAFFRMGTVSRGRTKPRPASATSAQFHAQHQNQNQNQNQKDQSPSTSRSAPSPASSWSRRTEGSYAADTSTFAPTDYRPVRRMTTSAAYTRGSTNLTSADVDGGSGGSVGSGRKTVNFSTFGSQDHASVSMSFPEPSTASAGSITSASPVLSPPVATRRSTRRHKHRGSSSNRLTLAEREVRQSERMSRLIPQLTAQSVTIDAQKELERYVSEYNAIMILRYVDRFINKAVGKAPGCYTVVGNRLVIDGERFAEELEGVFSDLPSTFEDALKNSAGEWRFPHALDAYVQMKWNSFQGKTIAGMKESDDSESETSEYEFEQETGGFMKRKTDTFSQDETDALQKMIDQGRAGNDQMLRLRRQCDETGWYRHAKPSDHVNGVSDTDEEDGGSESEASIRRFQERQNAKRKDRLSRRDYDP